MRTTVVFFLFLWIGLLCAAATFSQPIKLSQPSFQPKNPADVSIILNKKNTSLMAISSLFTSSQAGCIPGTCTPLPVKLLSFDGIRVDIDNVLLKWKTTNEQNNRGFDVERSLGTVDQFIRIAFVPAPPDSMLVKHYVLTDPNSFAGVSYYRLKQIDLDSQFVYSKIIAINNTGQQESLTLYPNPANNRLNLKIVSLNSANAKIFLCDVTGKIILQQFPYLQKGPNLQQMNVSALGAGMYYVRLYTAEGTALVSSFLKN